ncbi:MAG: UDP-N-acetylmuramoyl-L-alanyl-D-glutamate--2,6-diaminopimelate ligase [Chitinophagales bacterium]|nr:UDP-N-acetylmuramoyl-L-alanyl-D-glutamate--2,6-diaminopimelate ligase [Bacteroidota bacterium]
MLLATLLQGISYTTNLSAASQAQISFAELVTDSRKVQDKDVFVALKGLQHDGHQYLSQVAQKGVKVAIVNKDTAPELLISALDYIKVEDTNQILGVLAANFYGNPSQNLKVIGITGTNGKTTTATLLYRLFSQLGFPCGLISTIENKINQKTIPSTHTTPDALSLQKLFYEMQEAGCAYCFMEVSSHASVQGRINGTHFSGAVFTNITHDHLDYHGTFDAYIAAKKRFFDALQKLAFALVNADDKRAMVMLQNTAAKKYTYALKNMADFKARIIEQSIEGMLLEIADKQVFSPMVGTFNAYNLLAVYAVAILLGISEEEALLGISTLLPAEGRFDYVRTTNGILGIVDYAHTPDALEKILETITHLRTGNEQVITVVGCGGNRDAAKRPIMAAVACAKSNKVILTSDNPRNEDPYTILADMEKGISADKRANVLIIENRREAIRTACMLANEGDIVLVAGKGHEKYQEIKGERFDFDDKTELKNALNLQNS